MARDNVARDNVARDDVARDDVARPARLTARRNWGAAATVSAIGGVALAGLAIYQLAFHGTATFASTLAFVAGMGYLVWQFVLARLERPAVADPSEQTELEALSVVALVPVYNEDPAALRQCLASMIDQSRVLQAISVVDDGSVAGDYGEVRAWFTAAAADAGIRAHWQRQPNAGKRHAQMRALDAEPDADIYLTVDSDSILDPEATAECLQGFANPAVQSVAAVILTTNYRANLLTRIMDLYCVSLQLLERSALSRLGAVMVNCGGCAFYRGAIIRDNRATYLSETLFGRPVSMSDDSMLTLFALQAGRAIQQPTAFAFTLMPQRFSHHRRQQLRWMRGSFIRSGWRMRYLPIGRAAYWMHLLRWMQYAAITVLSVAGIAVLVRHPWLALYLAAGCMGIYTILASRYLSVQRSDQSLGQRWAVFATAPLTALWSTTVLRVFRWYAMATFANVGWGTRASVEVQAQT